MTSDAAGWLDGQTLGSELETPSDDVAYDRITPYASIGLPPGRAPGYVGRLIHIGVEISQAATQFCGRNTAGLLEDEATRAEALPVVSRGWAAGLHTKRTGGTHQSVAATETWERATARRVLAGVGTRYQHSAGVAVRAAAAAQALLAPDAAVAVRKAAWLHDIGYSPELAHTGFHPLDGARWLREREVEPLVVDLVAWHTAAYSEAVARGLSDQLVQEFARPDESALRVLTWADITSSPTGHPCRVHDRLAEILGRYPAGSPTHRAVRAARAGLVEIAVAVDEALRS